MKPPKAEKFKEQQQAIKQQLMDILKLEDATFNPEVKTKTLFEIDQEETKQKILDLIPQVKEYFTIRNVSLIYAEDTKRPHLTVIKEVLKKDYKVQSTFVQEGSIKTRRYNFYPLKPVLDADDVLNTRAS